MKLTDQKSEITSLTADFEPAFPTLKTNKVLIHHAVFLTPIQPQCKSLHPKPTPLTRASKLSPTRHYKCNNFLSTSQPASAIFTHSNLKTDTHNSLSASALAKDLSIRSQQEPYRTAVDFNRPSFISVKLVLPTEEQNKHNHKQDLSKPN